VPLPPRPSSQTRSTSPQVSIRNAIFISDPDGGDVPAFLAQPHYEGNLQLSLFSFCVFKFSCLRISPQLCGRPQATVPVRGLSPLSRAGYQEPRAFASTDLDAGASYQEPRAFASTDLDARASYQEPRAFASTDLDAGASYQEPRAFAFTDLDAGASYQEPRAFASTDLDAGASYQEPRAFASTDLDAGASYQEPRAFAAADFDAGPLYAEPPVGVGSGLGAVVYGAVPSREGLEMVGAGPEGDGYIMLADGDVEPSYFTPMGAPVPSQTLPATYFTPMTVTAGNPSTPQKPSNVFADPAPAREGQSEGRFTALAAGTKANPVAYFTPMPSAHA
jgi:hypothetical protein